MRCLTSAFVVGEETVGQVHGKCRPSFDVDGKVQLEKEARSAQHINKMEIEASLCLGLWC
jgi:hypothetical protein